MINNLSTYKYKLTKQDFLLSISYSQALEKHFGISCKNCIKNVPTLISAKTSSNYINYEDYHNDIFWVEVISKRLNLENKWASSLTTLFL